MRDWRQARNLPPHADIAIVSASLDFPIPDILTADGRKVIVYTTANPDPKRVSAIEKKPVRRLSMQASAKALMAHY
ncbi:hypothetical protein [Nitrosomonas aestuarii]|uniref:hypothetical protein n=1 Tax=Nitrosomonas aestuarii TaxID=52441 RepID=UPI000B858375|nr:hypothetical protein [Nitrosomonas aestuarii]